MTSYRSRLSRKNYRESYRKILLFGLLSIGLLVLVILLGIPLLIKTAVFLGNLKSTYSPIEENQSLPLAAPQIKPIYEATNSAQINIEGFADPEVKVEIFNLDISKDQTDTDKSGNFKFSDFYLEKGQNEIYIQATDKNNQLSRPSDKIYIIYDDVPPLINLIEPQENSSLFLPNGRVQIKGNISEAAEVILNNRLIILDTNNGFIYEAVLNEGNNNYRIIATDKAGNRTEKEFTLTRE